MSGQPKLSIILCSMNKFAMLAEALDSIYASIVPFDYEVILVDNGSQDDIAAFIQPRYPRIKLFKLGENRGFCRANNAGAAIASGELLLFLNTDTLLFPDTLALLVAKLDERPDIGVIGPLVLNTDRSFQLSFGRRLSIWSELWQKYAAVKREKRRIGEPPRRDILRRVGWVSGCCIMTRSAYFPGRQVFDDAIFLYFDDSELGARMRRMGHGAYFYSKPAIIHHGGQVVAQIPGQTMLEYRRSQLHVYQKHCSAWQRLLLRLYLRRKFSALLQKAPATSAEAACYKGILALIKKEGS